MKKTAVLLYPLFSLQEIGTLTELLKFYDRKIVTFSAGREPVKSEDGFTILPDRDLTEFCREEFDSLVLPGIWEPLPVLLDNRIIRFLEQFREDGDILIAAISAGPLLLGKAGLLEGRRFTHGVFEEFLDAFPVMPRENAVRTYLVEDGNLITAYGGAFGSSRWRWPTGWASTAATRSLTPWRGRSIRRRTLSSTCRRKCCPRPGPFGTSAWRNRWGRTSKEMRT